MRLDRYLTDNEIKAADFAETIGKSAATVSRIMRDKNPPDWDTMNKIMEATGGQVTPNDFLPGSSQAAE